MEDQDELPGSGLAIPDPEAKICNASTCIAVCLVLLIGPGSHVPSCNGQDIEREHACDVLVTVRCSWRLTAQTWASSPLPPDAAACISNIFLDSRSILCSLSPSLMHFHPTGLHAADHVMHTFASRSRQNKASDHTRDCPQDAFFPILPVA